MEFIYFETREKRECGRVISNGTLQANITELGSQKQYAALNPHKSQIRATTSWSRERSI